MSRFTQPLLVSPLPDGKTWVIKRDFGYEIGEENSGNVIDVPIEFLTDFASIPRLLWAYLPRWGRYGNAAVIHDWLYWEQKHTRREADLYFMEGMEVLHVRPIARHIIFYAVRTFGWLAWHRNAKAKARGERRVGVPDEMKAFQMPDDVPPEKEDKPQVSDEDRNEPQP